LEAGFTKSAEIDSTPFLTSVGGVPVGSLMGTMEEDRSMQTVDLAARGKLGAALSLIESTIGSFGPLGLRDGVRIRACSRRESSHSYPPGKGCHYVISTVWTKNWPVTAFRTKSAERWDKAGVYIGMATCSRRGP
jgi:hypothetical protein